MADDQQTPVHIDCQMFTTEESRVAVRDLMKLATPENIMLFKTWLERLQEAEKSEWRIKVKLLKYAALAGGALVLYHFLVDINFLDWCKKMFK